MLRSLVGIPFLHVEEDVKAVINIDRDGKLQLPPAIHESLRDVPLQVVSASSTHLLLGRQEAEHPVEMTGVLGEDAIPDLLSFYNMFRKTGILSFALPQGSKALYFQKGEIVFATSSFAEEGLGEVLFSLGKVERELLTELTPLVNEQQTLGKLLVERGAVVPKDLWLATRTQVESIVFNLFAVNSGGFYFQARPIDQEQIVRLSMNTQNMIMEGLRRLDEEALFMRKIISLDYYPVETGQTVDDLGQTETRLLKLLQIGQPSARELFRQAGVRELEGMRLLYGLLERKLVKMEDSLAEEVAGELGQILAAYNRLFKVLCIKLLKVKNDFLDEVTLSLRELQQPYSFVLRDVEVREDGSLDGKRIVDNLDGLEEGDKQKLLADALCEVALTQSMVVRRELPVEEAKALIARVQDVTTRVHELAERKP